jgi:hypothetical protein
MKHIVMLKDYNGYKAGEVYYIDNNPAAHMVNTGVAKFGKRRLPKKSVATRKTRMMRAGKNKKYNTK